MSELNELITALKLNSKLAYTSEELAYQLGTNPKKINELRSNGLLKGVKLGRSWAYSQAEVKDFLKRNRGKEL